MSEPGAESQPDEESRPEPQPAPSLVNGAPGSRAGMVGALLCLGAAVLTLIGTFLDLVVTRPADGPDGLLYVITSWDAGVEINGVAEPGPINAPLNGVPLLIGVAVLLAAAGIGMRAVIRPGGRLARIWVLAAVIGAAFLTATVVTVGMQVLWWLQFFEDVGDGTAGAQDTAGAGPGFLLPVIGAGLAIVAAVLAARRNPAEPVREEPDTPRLGTPIVVRRLPDEKQEEPG